MATPCASGGKTAPTLPLRMPQSGTERPSPHLRLVASKDRWSGSRTRHRGSQDHPPPAQLTAALHGAGRKNGPNATASDDAVWHRATVAASKPRWEQGSAVRIQNAPSWLSRSPASCSAGGRAAWRRRKNGPNATASDDAVWNRATVAASKTRWEQGSAVRFQNAPSWSLKITRLLLSWRSRCMQPAEKRPLCSRSGCRNLAPSDRRRGYA